VDAAINRSVDGPPRWLRPTSGPVAGSPGRHLLVVPGGWRVRRKRFVGLCWQRTLLVLDTAKTGLGVPIINQEAVESQNTSDREGRILKRISVSHVPAALSRNEPGGRADRSSFARS
jgi:hypothetical protein